MSGDPSREGGVSVLAAMTGAVVATTPTAPKPRLTALPGEANGPSILTPVAPALPATPAAFPYDMPTEALLHTIVDLERQRDALTAIINSLRLLAGDPEVAATVIATDAATTARAIEREADRRVADAAEVAAPAPDKKDKAAVARRKLVEADVARAEDNPLEAVVTAAEARDRKRAIQLAALVEAGTPEGDESFQDRMARLSQEAKDATFTPTEAATGVSQPVEDVDAWKCPTHSLATTKHSARRDRDYQACPQAGCSQFERL